MTLMIAAGIVAVVLGVGLLAALLVVRYLVLD